MHTNVLVPLDGTKSAETAVEEALQLAPAVRKVHLLLVENMVYQVRRLEGYTMYVDEFMRIRKEMGKDYLLPFQKKLEAAGVEVNTSILFGDPVPTITKVARQENPELILLGGTEGGWFTRHTGLAGIANRLSRSVDAKVMTVQETDGKTEKKAAKETEKYATAA